MTYCDPQSQYIQQESGKTARQLVKLFKDNGWPTRKIYGRTWIGRDAYNAWLDWSKRMSAIILADEGD